MNRRQTEYLFRKVLPVAPRFVTIKRSISGGLLHFRPKRILLTGGAGFIGSHLAEALLKRNVSLTIIDNFDTFYSRDQKCANLDEIRAAGDFECIEADFCDQTAVRSVVAASRPDAIIHLGARAGVRPSIEEPLEYERVNIRGTLNLLEVCREFAIQKFVFGSSSSVYGDTSHVPFSEDEVELRPISPYAATKLAGEMICYTYSHLFDTKVVCLRFFTVYGPRQRPDLAIHRFTALLEAQKPIPVFGDGSTGRDYTYVGDIVNGIVAALEYEPLRNDRAPFEVFNLGNSTPVKLSELISILEDVTGKTSTRQLLPSQAGDVRITWANIVKAEKLLGYRPQVKLEDGLRRFVEWYRTRPMRSCSVPL